MVLPPDLMGCFLPNLSVKDCAREDATLKRLQKNFNDAQAQAYLKLLCTERPEFCDSGQKVLQAACVVTNPKEYCDKVVEAVMEKFCGKQPNSPACSNQKPSTSDPTTTTEVTSTQRKMQMILIIGVVGVIGLMAFGTFVYFFFWKSSPPVAPPPQAQARVAQTPGATGTTGTPTAAKKRKKKKKKRRKKKATSSTSGEESKKTKAKKKKASKASEGPKPPDPIPTAIDPQAPKNKSMATAIDVEKDQTPLGVENTQDDTMTAEQIV